MIRKPKINTFDSQKQVADKIKAWIESEYSPGGANSFTIQIKVTETGKKAKGSWHQISKDPVMAMAAKYVKDRDNWQCRYSGDMVSGNNAHCCHIFSRSVSILRYDPDNLLTLSSFWHKHFDEGKDLWNDCNAKTKFIIREIGLDKLNHLRAKSQQKEKRTESEFKWRIFYENQK